MKFALCVLAGLILSACDGATMGSVGHVATSGGGNHSFVLDTSPTISNPPPVGVPDPDYHGGGQNPDFGDIQNAGGDNTAGGHADFDDIQDNGGNGGGGNDGNGGHGGNGGNAVDTNNDQATDFDAIQNGAGG